MGETLLFDMMRQALLIAVRISAPMLGVALVAGVDVESTKMALKREVELLGGRLPAEHGHGTESAGQA